MSNPATRVESKVISDAEYVYSKLKQHKPAKGKLLTLPLEVHRKPMITVKGLVPGEPKAQKTIFDDKAPMIEELEILGYSIYRGENAGGMYERVVAHHPESHSMDVIKVQQDIFSDKSIKERLFISKSFVHDMLSVGEDDEVQDVVAKNPKLSDPVWF